MLFNFYCSKTWYNKSFKTKFNCQKHKLICSRPKPKLKQCYLCKKEFSKLANLKRYLGIHTKIKKRKRIKKSLNPPVKDWLSDELGFKSNIIFRHFLEHVSKNSSPTGRKDHKLNDQTALKAYEFLKDNYTVSADRRNQRNVLKISQKYNLCAKVLLIQMYPSLKQNLVRNVNPIGIYIYMKSLHTMHSNFIKTNLTISISTLYRLKPSLYFNKDSVKLKHVVVQNA